MIACSRHIYIGVILRVHSVRGELHIQRNASGEVAKVLASTSSVKNHSQRTLWFCSLAGLLVLITS